MQKRVAEAQGKLVLEVGDTVRVGVAEVDRGRTDPSSMVLVIVEVLQFTADEVKWKYRLASPRGVMKAVFNPTTPRTCPRATSLNSTGSDARHHISR